ncbi:MAG TPA: trypsin-like peptidase domain-containing protein [Planctomycetaceae bacterium]|jgi:serine protease Do|nr:trypsin-like peptidase domain-containing protein [Planctomycetaceae bacterium]
MNMLKSALSLFLLAAATPAWADVLEMKTGQKIEAPVLKEASDALYVDLGFDVVRVPTAMINKRHHKGDKAPSPSATGEECYMTARLPVRTVKELAATYGEGVVLVQTPAGLGSGFLINARGYCITNYHVIERETRVAVTLFHRGAGGEFTRRRIDDVKIIALNPFLDLALLRVPEQPDFKFQPVYLSHDDDQKEGDEVFAIGNPLGLERSVSRGIVSTRNRSFQGLVYIQTTTQINPGNSGGPLFNARGEVVGVTNMKAIFGEGIGFAIPVSYLKHFLANRDSFAFDKNNPNTGYRYLDPPRRRNLKSPPAP